jgi:hypothetical protein
MLRIPFATLGAFALLTPVSASPPSSGMHRRPTIRYFIATAHAVEGTGASGKWPHPGTVAADRKVLPLKYRWTGTACINNCDPAPAGEDAQAWLRHYSAPPLACFFGALRSAWSTISTARMLTERIGCASAR